MWFLLAISLFTGMFVAVENAAKQIIPEVKSSEARAARLDYDIFVMAADSYMKQYPSAVGTYSWGQVKKSISSTMNVDTVPSNWQLKIYQSGRYVICTPMDGQDDIDTVLTHSSADRRPVRVDVTLITSTNNSEAQQQKNRCTSGGTNNG